MKDLILTGGVWMYPMILMSFVVIVLSVKKGLVLFRKNNLTSNQLEKGMNAILFWGATSLLFGLLAQMAGLYQALGFIKNANDISLGIVAGGLRVSLTYPIFGMLTFIFSALIWFVLRSKYKSLRLRLSNK